MDYPTNFADALHGIHEAIAAATHIEQTAIVGKLQRDKRLNEVKQIIERRNYEKN